MPPIPIPSPYNFVPLSEHVFFPDWAAQVSHDVPFSDGISGWFEIEVEATTPIYVRNGGDLPERDHKHPLDWLNNPDVQSFFKLPDGRFAIPGTSLKGVIRSVVEIASYGRFNRVDEKRYAVRDLNNHHVYGQYLTDGDKKIGYFPKAKAGWLMKQPDGSWQIIPCDMARVEQEDLEVLFDGLSLGRKQSAGKKYHEWQCRAKSLCLKATVLPDTRYVMHSQPLRYKFAENLLVNPVGRVMLDPTLVFTGQPQNRRPQTVDYNGSKRSGGKHMEFLFYAPKINEALFVSPKVREEFLFIHSIPEGGDNEDLTELKKRFSWKDGKPMPVFYLSDDKTVSAMGLAMMFRLPYLFSPADLAAKQQPDSEEKVRFDFAETIFGAVEKEFPLKGRVYFESLLANPDTITPAERPVLTVLGSPKPTYYPNYLKQDINPHTKLVDGEYHTYMEAILNSNPPKPASTLRGWKRYISRPDKFQPDPNSPPVNEEGKQNLKVATSFRPLEAGARFRGRIHVHNIRPVELGAIIWALTWGGRTDLRHRLGMAKPYGYGHVKISFASSSQNDPACKFAFSNSDAPAENGDEAWIKLRSYCQQQFTTTLGEWCNSSERQLGKWEDTIQLRSLIRLATQINDAKADWPHELDYPPEPRDFANYKARKQPMALLPVISFDDTEAACTLVAAKAKQNEPAEPNYSLKLPNLTGQKRRVSFQKPILKKDGRVEVIELWFSLKHKPAEGREERFDAVLRNPVTPKLRAPLKPGDSHELFVVGIEGDKYILAESLET